VVPANTGVVMDRISASIRDIVDFPKPGIVFKDITPMMRDPALMRHVVVGTRRAPSGLPASPP